MNEAGRQVRRQRRDGRPDLRPVNGTAVGGNQPREVLKLVGEVPWQEFPLRGLLRLVSDMFTELLVPTEPDEVTEVHYGKAAMLRVVLAEVLERAGRLYPPSALVCACGEVFKTADEMDEHFWAMFVPKDDVGTDGRVHGEMDREWLMARVEQEGAETEVRTDS